MNTIHVIALVAVLGAVAIVAGVALLVGAAWALIAGGVLTIASSVVLYDPNDMRADVKPR